MWIEQRTENNYKFVEQYKDPLTNKYHRVSITLNRIQPIQGKKLTKFLSKEFALVLVTMASSRLINTLH